MGHVSCSSNSNRITIFISWYLFNLQTYLWWFARTI